MPGGIGCAGVSRSTERGRVMLNRHSGLKFLTGAIAAVALSAMPALAADLPYRPPPPEPFVLDIHGFFDVQFKNDYITPRGLLVTNTGLTTQALMGQVLDLYKDPNGFINKVSFTVGPWNDLWSEQRQPFVGAWNEFDWFVGTDVVFARDWTFSAVMVQFLSPPTNFHTEPNAESTLKYSDKGFAMLPIAINPYVRLWKLLGGLRNCTITALN